MVLCTDGEASFAIFIYHDLPVIRRIISDENGLVGFDAGDRSRGVTVLYGEEDFPLNEVNVFRVDGKVISSLLTFHLSCQP